MIQGPLEFGELAMDELNFIRQITYIERNIKLYERLQLMVTISLSSSCCTVKYKVPLGGIRL
jgi:hypothetical protein